MFDRLGDNGLATDDFQVLGKGTFGKVMLARQKGTSNIYAVKILKKETLLKKDELQHTLTENSVLAKCTHPFLTILKVYQPQSTINDKYGMLFHSLIWLNARLN